MPVEEKIIMQRADHWGNRPQNPHAALTQARDLLAEEGKWCTGSLFADGDAETAFANGSICGDWQACAFGAIALVAGEMPVRVVKTTWENDDYSEFSWTFEDPSTDRDSLTFKAGQVLALAIKGDDISISDPQSIVFGFNDNNSTREVVLQAFDEAIKIVKKPSVLRRIFGKV